MLRELDVSRPLLIGTERWRELELPVPRRFHGVRAALEAIRDADGLVALGPAGFAIAAPSSPTSNGPRSTRSSKRPTGPHGSAAATTR